MARGVAGTALGGGGGESSSSAYSAYGISVKENQALYNQYLGAYKDVLSGVSNVGNAQRQALTDFYAQKQGQSDQSLISRGLGNTTVVDSANRGLALDEGKAQNDLSERVARMKADYESQMAGGIHSFMGGYSESQSQSQRAPTGFGGGGMQGPGPSPWGRQGGFSAGTMPTSDVSNGWGAGIYGPSTMMGGGGPQQFGAIPQLGGGDFAGVQGSSGYDFAPSGALQGMGGQQEQPDMWA